MHLPSFTKKHLTIGIVAFMMCVTIGLGLYLFIHAHAGKSSGTKSIQEYAQMMVDKCASAPYRPTCYENEVPKLVTELPMSSIFDVIRAIRGIDHDYLYCHVLAHKLGSYEVSLDPNNWLNAIAEGPTDGLCSNGFAHGAIVTRFHGEELSQKDFDYAVGQLANACEDRPGWNPTELTKAICYHGIGHVLVHMSQANIPNSLASCKSIAIKPDGRDYTKLCTEGVYMQLYQPLEPEDYALIDKLPMKPTRDNLKEFCTTNSQNDLQYGACWREAWPLIGDDIHTGSGITNFCSQLTDAQGKDQCFISAVTINGRQNLGTPDKMAATCNELSDQYKGTCFARGANAFLEEDQQLVPQGVNMCGRANTLAAQDECYGFLASVSSFNFHKGSAPFEQLCTLLPQKWQQACRGDQ